eukprot:m.1641175 g.1641175  ORF g.1641175 m.1641175 type:complete len:279 (-) comp46042_c0_seq1:643-1479(-)
MTTKQRNKLYPDLLSMFNSVRGITASPAAQGSTPSTTRSKRRAESVKHDARSSPEIHTFRDQLARLAEQYEKVRTEARKANESLTDVYADADHLEEDLRCARDELSDLQKSGASKIVLSLQDTVERVNAKIKRQGLVNDEILADICKLQESKANLADESFRTASRIEQVQASVDEAASFLQAQDTSESTVEETLQQTTHAYKKRLSELQGEIDTLSSEKANIGKKRKALTELRSRNREMLAVVNLVKESLLNADDETTFENASQHGVKHRRVRFENRA